MSDTIYSDEQNAIFDFVKTGKGNIMVKAGAGCGKTFTATNATRFMVEMIQSVRQSVIAVSFNKSIAKELGYKYEEMGLDVASSTVHSNGNTNYRRFNPKVKVVLGKIKNIVFDMIDDDDDLKFARWPMVKLVNFARDYGFGIKGCPSITDVSAWQEIIAHQDISFAATVSIDDVIDTAIRVLKESNRRVDEMDFGDMVYLPILLDIPFTQYDWVIVDEAQDTNVVRKLIIEKLLKKGGRAMIIGDPRQAIYGFAGAENDSMDKLSDLFDCTLFPLMTCYRCGSEIVKLANEWEPTLVAHPDNGTGEVKYMTYDNFSADVNTLKLDHTSGIICRNNAPLASIAFELIRNGIGCIIRGQDIGKAMITLANKWKFIKDMDAYSEKLSQFFDKEMEKAGKGKKAMLQDRYQTILVIMERCKENGDGTRRCLVKTIEDMFKVGPRYKNFDADAKVEDGIVVLSSIHKAKGLEFETCYIVGMSQLQPSPYATQEWMIEQEMNLAYVATTRAKHTLVHITDIPQFNKKDQEEAV